MLEEQVKQALFLGAHKFHRDEDGCTALHWAAMKGAVAAATVLTSGSNRDVEVRGSVGWMARRDIRLVCGLFWVSFKRLPKTVTGQGGYHPTGDVCF